MSQPRHEPILRRLIAAVLLLSSSAAWPAFAQSFGWFVGTVQSEWLEDGRRMRLLAPFGYIDPAAWNGMPRPGLLWMVRRFRGLRGR